MFLNDIIFFFILLSMFLNKSQMYFNFNKIDILHETCVVSTYHTSIEPSEPGYKWRSLLLGV